MTREIDLVSYLPPFVAQYKEIRAALEAENPEFKILWEAASRTLYNEFIETADESGITRFETILNIFPSKEDTLASRRKRVQARWISVLPYTERMLLEKLVVLCGSQNFTLIKKYESYRIELGVSLELYGQVEELEHMIEVMLPCNMVAVIQNTINIEIKGSADIATGVCFAECFLITNDSQENIKMNGSALYGGSFINTAHVTII